MNPPWLAGLALLLLFTIPSLWAEPPPDSQQLMAISQQAIGNKVGEYSFTDTAGGRRNLTEWQGKPLVISMIYTSCYQTCSMTTRNLAEMVEKTRQALGNDSFQVITIGFDTRRDTRLAMDRFARQQDVNKVPGWAFLTANEETLDGLTKDLGFKYFTSPRGYDHVVQATILDQEGVVYRQVYGEVFELPQLAEPIKELVLGRPRPSEPLLDEVVRRVRFLCTTYDANDHRYRFDYSIFIGMFIGGSIILFFAIWIWREWRRPRSSL